MKLLKSKKRILLVGNEGVVLFAPAFDNVVEHEITLAWDVPDFAGQLTAALGRQHRDDPVVVLFDGASQTYRREDNIPRLGAFDRGRFLRRRLHQAFPNYPVRAFLPLQKRSWRGSGDETRESYLFAAIPETDTIDKIAAPLLEAGVPVAGFGLLPVESTGLVTALAQRLFGDKGARARWSVLIGQNETGGIRQVVVKDGVLALTRMTPASESGLQGPGWVEDVMREFKATLTYIARFGYTPEEGLDVIVVAGEAEKKAFEQQKYLPGSHFRCLRAAEALAALGLGAPLSSAGSRGMFSDALHALWTSQKRFLDFPVRVPSIDRILVPRRVAQVGGIALAVLYFALMGFSFSLYQDYSALRVDIEQKQNQKTLLEREYEQESRVFDSMPVKPQTVRSTLAVFKDLETGSASVTPLLNALHGALDPDVRLSSLRFDHAPSARDAAGPGAVVLTARFSLTGLLPLEQKVIRTEKIVDKMRQAFPGWTVRIVSQFGNVSRTGKFEGAAGAAPAVESADRDYAEIELRGAPL